LVTNSSLVVRIDRGGNVWRALLLGLGLRLRLRGRRWLRIVGCVVVLEFGDLVDVRLYNLLCLPAVSRGVVSIGGAGRM